MKCLGSRSGAAADLLDEDVLRRAITQRDARSADLAEQSMSARNLFHDSGFAKTHFPKPLANFSLPFELLHSA
ncbi:MAG: hypothetical protein QM790_15735 [Nibricoccus sp.]